ncbi:hypothetical protein B4U80_13166 [Leptotrombidium deliense]|uniref:Uncharacterized protein n=1 Tax=Leptotrombidium deliense TaxID=299467 RepID=A0A443SB71_9ACAR|nr:hypothetical protein B4U80_13166 [Leptotrombidium deliense]
MSICKQNLNIDVVRGLKLADFSVTNSNYTFVADTFPNLRRITIASLKLNNNSISHLLTSLTQLKTVNIEIAPITGIAFEHVANRLRTLQWQVRNATDMNGFPYSQSITSFSLTVLTENSDLDFALQQVTEKMPNLRELFINAKGVETFGSLKLNNLRSLSLQVNRLYDTTTINLQTVMKLKLTIQRHDFAFGKVFIQFQKLKIIEIKGANMNVLSAALIIALQSVETLESFVLKEETESLFDYMYNMNGETTNLLYELFEALDFVEYFEVHVNCKDYSNDQLAVLYAATKPLLVKQRFPYFRYVSVKYYE